MKAKEFKQFFKGNEDESEPVTRFARHDYKGFYQCLLCGKTHRYGLHYTIGKEQALICHHCHLSLFYGRKVRNLAELKKTLI